EDTVAYHQPSRCGGGGSAPYKSAREREAGADGAGAVVAAHGLGMAGSAAADGGRARAVGGAAGGWGVRVGRLLGARPGPLCGERTVGDGGGCKPGNAIHESPSVGIAGRGSAAAIGPQRQVADEGTAGDG